MHRLLSYWQVLGFAISLIIFLTWPQLDLAVAGLFYDGDLGGFYLAKQPLVYAVYKVFAKLHFVLLLVFLALWWYWRRTAAELRQAQIKRVKYLLLVLLLGPGLLVNVVLKDNSVGRARPSQVLEFDGSKQFSPAFYNAQQCERNCSFVSGHAALGFYFIAFAWAFGRRWLFPLGMAVGVVVGLGRIIQGGHFLSDVVFAFWFVYLVAWLCARAMQLAQPK